MTNTATLPLETMALDKKPSFIAPSAPTIITVSPEERAALMATAKQLHLEFQSYENPAYISTLHLYAFQLLPLRIARSLSNLGTDFSASQYGAIIFKGLVEVDQDELGPTPASWKETDPNTLVLYGFICTLLHGAVPSKPVQYYVQRKGGGLMHAIIPDEKMSYSQTGSGSRTDLFVHTEDAFLFNPADFLSFLYLRNEEQVNSTLYSIRSHGELGPLMNELFRPIFKCPKDANFDENEAIGEEIATSVLYGNRKTPFIRFDAAEQIHNSAANQAPEAELILKSFWQEAKKHIYDAYIPQAGDLIFVNNHLCAHGRTAFVAGIRYENGEMIKCERRMMLRMMSKTSLIQISEVAHPNDPYFIIEDHYGRLAEVTNADKKAIN